MLLSFTLSMPGVASWNGRWTGDGGNYVVVRAVLVADKQEALKLIGSHRYNWDDGWAASVKVEPVDSREARKLRKASIGFCGYDWMIDSLLKSGSISPPTNKGTRAV